MSAELAKTMQQAIANINPFNNKGLLKLISTSTNNINPKTAFAKKICDKT
jgi:hypothetical protein